MNTERGKLIKRLRNLSHIVAIGAGVSGCAELDEAAELLERDIKAIYTLAEHLDCLIDFVCESNAIRMHGASGAVRDARKALVDIGRIL